MWKKKGNKEVFYKMKELWFYANGKNLLGRKKFMVHKREGKLPQYITLTRKEGIDSNVQIEDLAFVGAISGHPVSGELKGNIVPNTGVRVDVVVGA